MAQSRFISPQNNMDQSVDTQRSYGYNFPYPMVSQGFPTAGPVGGVGAQAHASHQFHHHAQYQNHNAHFDNMNFQNMQHPASGPYAYIPQYQHMVHQFQMPLGANLEAQQYYQFSYPQQFYSGGYLPYPPSINHHQASYNYHIPSPAPSIATTVVSTGFSTHKSPLSPTTTVASSPSKKMTRRSPVIASTPMNTLTVEEEFEAFSAGMSDFSGSNPAANVYIKGLPSTMTDKQLREMVSPFGEIISSKAIVDRPAGVCKGYGFAKFTSAESAEACIKDLTEKKYEVTIARDSFYSRLKDLADLQSTNLYVSNLPNSWGEERITSLFSNYEVNKCRLLVTPRGQSRGVAFVTFKDRNTCDEIIEKFNGIGLGEPQHALSLQVRYADTLAQKKLKKEKHAAGQFPKKSVIAHHNQVKQAALQRGIVTGAPTGPSNLVGMSTSSPLLTQNPDWAKKDISTLPEGVNAPPTPPQSVISSEDVKSEKEEDHN